MKSWKTNLVKGFQDKRAVAKLPIFPKIFFVFVQLIKPYVGEIKRNWDMIPFWVHIYKNMERNMIIICGRQIFKSTFLGDFLLFTATTQKRAHTMYVGHSPESAESFSDERIREEGFLSNKLLKKYLPYEHRAAKKVIKLLNGTFMRFTHPKRKYGKTEGYTISALVCDEIQKHQELQHLGIARRTLRTTKGTTILTGIGIGEGSELHYMITEESDIYEWKYKDQSTLVEENEIILRDGTKKTQTSKWPEQGWRRHLKFDKDGLRNFTPDEAQLYMTGKFVCINPLPGGQKREWITYHMPQRIFPQIPLTIHQAKTLYYTNIQDSIEYQKIHDSPMEYMAHCEGWFFPDEARPLTPAHIKKCQDDTVEFLTPSEIMKLKTQYGNTLHVLLGIDWGSNQVGASFTVGVIILHWRSTDSQSSRYQIAFIDKRPVGDTKDMASHFVNMIKEWYVDFCVADMGHEKDVITKMQNGGFSQDGGTSIPALGTSKVMGVWTGGNLTEETKTYYAESDKHGRDLAKITIDKTEWVDKLIGIIKSTVPNLDNPTDKNSALSKMIIPWGPSTRMQIDYLERELTAIRRIDKIDEMSDGVKSPIDKRQHAQRLYAHAGDTVMALLYSLIAADRYSPDGYTIHPIKRTKTRRTGNNIRRR